MLAFVDNMDMVTTLPILDEKAERLRQILAKGGRLVVAYSGGVDGGSPARICAKKDSRTGFPASGRRGPARPHRVRYFFSSMQCTPLFPFTTWVMRRSAARLASM